MNSAPCNPVKIEYDDLDDIMQIEELCFPGDCWSRASFEQSLTDDTVFFRGIRSGGKIVSYILAYIIPHAEAQIGSIATRPEFSGKGFARCLMNECLNACSAQDIEDIYLEVRESNLPARSLYQSLGFQADGIRKAYYSDGEDAILMSVKGNTSR